MTAVDFVRIFYRDPLGRRYLVRSQDKQQFRPNPSHDDRLREHDFTYAYGTGKVCVSCGTPFPCPMREGLSGGVG